MLYNMVVFVHQSLRCTFCAVYGSFCASNSQAYILSNFCTSISQVYVLCCIWQFLYINLSGVHFVLYMAVFVHQTLRHTFWAVYVHQSLRCTFCAVYGSFCMSISQVYVLCCFCTSNSQAYVLCSIWHFLHIKLSGVHFVLYMALFAHQTLRCAFRALYGTFCILCSIWQFLHKKVHLLPTKSTLAVRVCN